jgi:hypothetical protein
VARRQEAGVWQRFGGMLYRRRTPRPDAAAKGGRVGCIPVAFDGEAWPATARGARSAVVASSPTVWLMLHHSFFITLRLWWFWVPLSRARVINDAMVCDCA